MRYLVLTLGILGGVVGAALGMYWIGQYNDLQTLITRPDMAAVVEAADMQTQLAAATALMRAAYVLVAGLFLGIGGGVMAVRHQGKVAAGLMLAAPVVAAVLVPKTLIASFLLVLGGVLALMIKPAATDQLAA
jgi:hypothetical protein